MSDGDLLKAIQAIRANAGGLLGSASDGWLFGAEQALLHVLGKKSHLMGWLRADAMKIAEAHCWCTCGACKYARKLKEEKA